MGRTWSRSLTFSLLVHLLLLFLFPTVPLPNKDTLHSPPIPVYIIEPETAPVAPELPPSPSQNAPPLESGILLTPSAPIDSPEEPDAGLEQPPAPLPTPTEPPAQPDSPELSSADDANPTDVLVHQQSPGIENLELSLPALAESASPTENDLAWDHSALIDTEEPAYQRSTASSDPRLLAPDPLSVGAEAPEFTTPGLEIQQAQRPDAPIPLPNKPLTAVITLATEPAVTLDVPESIAPGLSPESAIHLPPPGWGQPSSEHDGPPPAPPAQATALSPLAMVDALRVNVSDGLAPSPGPTSGLQDPAILPAGPQPNLAVVSDSVEEPQLPSGGQRLSAAWNGSSVHPQDLLGDGRVSPVRTPKQPGPDFLTDDGSPSLDTVSVPTPSTLAQPSHPSLETPGLTVAAEEHGIHDERTEPAPQPAASPNEAPPARLDLLSSPNPTANWVEEIPPTPAATRIEPPVSPPSAEREFAVQGAPERGTASFTEWDHYVAPTYPRRLRQLGVQGYVDVEIQTNPAGEIVTWQIIGHAGHPAFRSAVEEVVAEWRFHLDPSWSLLNVSPPPFTVRVEFELDH